MNYWLHRISHYAKISYPLIDAGYLSIGFSKMASAEFIEDAINGKEEAFHKAIIETYENIPRSSSNLWAFLNQMKTGDVIVVPSWGTFSVYRITGEKPIVISDVKNILEKDWTNENFNWDDIDLGFAWKVELAAKNIPRDLFTSSKLASRLKARPINMNISELKEDIEKSLEAYRLGKPTNMRAALIEKASPEWKQSIHERLDSNKFEKLVEWYLKKMGADFTDIPAKANPNNGDADVVARFENIKACINVLVKFYDGTTPRWEVHEIRNFAEAASDADEYHTIPWIITSADSCSKGARLVAKENNVRLICMDEFVRMLMAAGFENANDF